MPVPLEKLDVGRAQAPANAVNAGSVAFERHFTPEQLAELWGVSSDTIRRLFLSEPGVLVIEHAKGKARRYRTLRIPESVALRVHRRMTNVVAMPSR